MSEGVFSGGKALRAIIAAVFVASAVAGLIVVMLALYPYELLATASLNYSTIDYAKVTCVSIGPHRVTVEGKDVPDPTLAKSIADFLAIRTVLFGAPYSECPWDFSVNVAPGPIIAVRYGLLPAEYLVSVAICERTGDVHVNPNKCLSKNVYVFNWRAKPHDLFRIGIIGLKPQAPDMEEIRMRADDD
jgi:hypothetical protein